jgi:N6-adenosine-specific RNA methylase IME4
MLIHCPYCIARVDADVAELIESRKGAGPGPTGSRTGEWLRGQTEHCMLAVRGKPVFLHGSHPTVLQAARREHSRKPEEFYALVEATCPGGKVELFCRQLRTEWQSHGMT